ncbi:MAG: hypothetical protein ACOYI2_10750 [Bacillota bacterium]|jgi:hypothetical protein|nr:hypothetical protein [Clostridia bacterium]
MKAENSIICEMERLLKEYSKAVEEAKQKGLLKNKTMYFNKFFIIIFGRILKMDKI